MGAVLGSRGNTGGNRSIGRDSSSDGSDEWDTERRAALQADRAAVEAAWGAHVADNDVASLRWKAVRSWTLATFFAAAADTDVAGCFGRLYTSWRSPLSVSANAYGWCCNDMIARCNRSLSCLSLLPSDTMSYISLGAAQAEADSQVQLYRAQISKMQLALERADQENSRVEQELRIALDAPGKLREAQAEKRAGSSSLAVLRDRVRSMSLLAPSAEPRAEERLQVGSSCLLYCTSTSHALHSVNQCSSNRVGHCRSYYTT